MIPLSHCYLIKLFVGKLDESWRMTIDYCKLNQMISLVVAAILDMVSSPEQINTASSTWYAATHLTAEVINYTPNNAAVHQAAEISTDL